MMTVRSVIAGLALLVAASFATLLAHAAAGATLQSWRVVLVAGDDSIPVFDNAVDKLRELLGAKPGLEVRMLTSDRRRRSAERPIATAAAIDSALQGSAAQGCLVFLTSHGSQDGLLLDQDQDNRKLLSPGKLDRILDKQCGARPTVVVVSACHSGVFIGKASKGDNRIWLTAARDDKVSFGCGAEFKYTYFDECLLNAWPKSQTWKQLFDRAVTCVRLKESELSESSSMPQAFFGAGVKDLQLP